LLVLGLYQLGGFEPLENAVYTTLFRLRGPKAWDSRLVVVAIDDDSLAQLGRYPWPRQRYQQILDKLNQAQVSVVGLDILFAEPSADDAGLARSLNDLGVVVVAEGTGRNGTRIQPVPEIAKVSAGVGHIDATLQSDGMSRWIKLYGSKTTGFSSTTSPNTSRSNNSFALEITQLYNAVGQAVKPPANTDVLWINWPGPVQTLPQYSAAQLLSNQVPPSALANKIVLVGVTATGLDPQITPYDLNPPASGVHLHAAAINSILQRSYFRPLQHRWVLLSLLVGGPVLSYGLSRLREAWQLVCWGMASSLSVLVSVMLFQVGVLAPVIAPLGLITSTAAILALWERIRVGIYLQRQVEQVWQMVYPYPALEFAGLDSPGLGPQALEPRALEPAGLGPAGLEAVALNPALKSPIQPPPWLESAQRFHTPVRLEQSAHRLIELAEQLSLTQASQMAIATSLPIGVAAVDLNQGVWFCNPLISQLLGVAPGQRLESVLVPRWLTAEQWQRLWNQTSPEPLEILQPAESPIDLQAKPQASVEPPPLSGRDHADHASYPAQPRWWELQVQSFNYNQHLTADEPSSQQLSQHLAQQQGKLLLVKEITARKQLERHLQQQVTDLRGLSDRKDEFLSLVSHELRTPLTNIRMAIELMSCSESSEETAYYLNILENECSREVKLINDLLDLQRIEAGAQSIQVTSIQLQPWLEALVLPFHKRAEKLQQRLELQITPVAIATDAIYLEQILSELLNNACKYTPPGGLIRLQIAPSLQEKSGVILTLGNSGVTIPTQVLPKIFDKFYRIPQSDINRQGGSGLGLALVKRLVDLLQGQIQVQSQDEWTQFDLLLPLQFDHHLRQ
jgi:signal transduction histidine kinase/CHASE2 domain-containing sensor protein